MDIGTRAGGAAKIAVPRLNRIANFDDLDPLVADPNLTVEIIEAGTPLPGNADLVLIPGSKSTIADLDHFRAQGWDLDLTAHIRRGGHVLGVCGGYQMLGQEIHDDDGIEGPPRRVPGLGHLDVITVMTPKKTLALTKAHYGPEAIPLQGYEIHIGTTEGPDRAHAWLDLGHRREGAASANGQIRGCYLHGLFSSDRFRAAYLSDIGIPASALSYEADVDATLDALAVHMEAHFDIDHMLNLAREITP